MSKSRARYAVIQLATFEDVLASVCYIVYWVHTALQRAGVPVTFHEDQTYRGADDVIRDLPADVVVLLDISTSPQIETALALWRKWRDVRDVRFVGYKPYIDLIQRARYFDVSEEGARLSDGAFNYLYNIETYKHAHATLDSHIVCPDGDQRLFMPAFLSVGCPRACDYCYITKTNYPSALLPLAECKRLIDYVGERGWNLHIEDENFFWHPDSTAIVEHIGARRDMKWICITDTLSLGRAVREHGEQWLLDNGNHLNECGLESVVPSVLRKSQDMSTLIDAKRINIFWLSVVLFPDETVESLHLAGRFYAEHGMSWERLVPRLKTQSSVGGCGQFFQPYPGTKFWPRAQEDGVFIAYPHLRLRPSWVGHALLRDVPVATGSTVTPDDERWVRLYTDDLGVAERIMSEADGVRTVDEITRRDPEALAVLASITKLGYLHPTKRAVASLPVWGGGMKDKRIGAHVMARPTA